MREKRLSPAPSVECSAAVCCCARRAHRAQFRSPSATTGAPAPSVLLAAWTRREVSKTSRDSLGVLRSVHTSAVQRDGCRRWMAPPPPWLGAPFVPPLAIASLAPGPACSSSHTRAQWYACKLLQIIWGFWWGTNTPVVDGLGNANCARAPAPPRRMFGLKALCYGALLCLQLILRSDRNVDGQCGAGGEG